MKKTALFFTLTALIGFMLGESGCMMAARRQKAQTAFERLAARSPDQIAGFLDHRLAARLDLTAAQLPRVYAIDLDYAIKVQAAAASREGVLSKARTMEKAGDAHTADLKEVLTPDQFAQFLTIKEELRTAIKEGGAGGK